MTAASEAFVGGIRAGMFGGAAVMCVLAVAALLALRGLPKVIEQEEKVQ